LKQIKEIETLLQKREREVVRNEKKMNSLKKQMEKNEKILQKMPR
jgi:hypothetical protein